MEKVQEAIIKLAFMLEQAFYTKCSFYPSEIWNKFLQEYPEDKIDFTTLIYNTPLWFDRRYTRREKFYK